MVRLRREQYANTMQAAVAQARTRRISRLDDLASIIGPSKKSVHIIKNRLTLVRSGTSAAAAALRASTHTLLGKASALKTRLQRRGSEATVAPAAPAPKPKLTIIKETPPAPPASRGKLFARLPGGQDRQPRLPALERARQAMASNDNDKAESLLVIYLSHHPKNARAYMLLGQIASAQRNWPEAIEIFQQVVKINPALPGAYSALGEAAFESGKFTLAIEALQRAHSAEPTNVDTIRRLLKIAQRMDNTPMQRSLAAELKALQADQIQAVSN